MRLAILLVLLSTSKLFAGDSVGHGGDLVTCETEQGITREVLDYFEARQKDATYRLLFSDGFATALEKVNQVIKMLQGFDPARASRYADKALRFKKESKTVPSPLEIVKDTGEILLPAGCKMEQLAIQRPPAFPGDQRYLLDEVLWGEIQNDSDEQAGLELHEIVYGETLALGQEDSVLAREFNRTISSADFVNFTQAEYDLLAAKVFVAPPKVSFVAESFSFEVIAGQKLSVHLMDLVRPESGTGLEWFADADEPKWVSLNSPDSLLTASPAIDVKPGDYRFLLIVRKGNSHAIAPVTFHVKD